MNFNLTDELSDSIISAMDNQTSTFLVDAAKETLIEQNNSVKSDDNFYYNLPEWSPSDGFSMRESFVNCLHAPMAHDELQSVLHSGRGVFKNFKIVLRKYPEVEKRWHIFKNKVMLERIHQWYNNLREVWGLERLDQLSEAEASLVYDDFSFCEYESDKNQEEVLFNTSAFLQDENQNLPSEIKCAIYELWSRQFKEADKTPQIGFVCHSYSEDFAGCITASQLFNTQKKIMVITSLYVPQQFRGLGIGTELISQCISEIQEKGNKWIILPAILAPEFLQPLLTRFGFEKTSSGYIAEIQ
ncbi:MAG: GNAT family N-acetyltransferase [Treponema sp.]|nr:GNAT family N-acetyltransferase [Spirochaetia bacterium]MDY2839139.1 GNAT family N-acetyltransferase [Treponema sp.]